MLILSYPQAQAQLKQRPNYYDVISLGPDAMPRALCRSQLVLDIDDLLSIPNPADCRRPDERTPQIKHVTQALSFARKSDDEHLLIHCAAGLSRSPAIAWCILLDRHIEPHKATAKLFEMHAGAIPNPIIVRCGLHVLTGSTKEFAAVRSHMRLLSRHPEKEDYL